MLIRQYRCALISCCRVGVQKVIVEAPKNGEVRVQLEFSGVCHTDAYTLSGKDPEGIFPCILGHEGCGIVESVGPEVTEFQPGDKVIPLYIPECGKCKFCTSGKTNLCSVIRLTQGKGVMPDGTSRFRTEDGKTIYHFMGCSTFSQYTVLPAISLAKIDPVARGDRCCLLGCGVTTGWGAAVKTAQVTPGSTVAIFGLGGVGLSVIQGAKQCGASRIIGIDLNPRRFTLAKELGATECINPNDISASERSIQEILVEMTDGGLDYTFECIGNPKTMRAALEACHKGWGISVIIGVAEAGAEITTRPFQLVTGRTWKGSAFGGIKGKSELPSLVDAYMKGTLYIDPYVTHQFKLDQINESFTSMHEGECIRSIISL